MINILLTPQSQLREEQSVGGETGTKILNSPDERDHASQRIDFVYPVAQRQNFDIIVRRLNERSFYSLQVTINTQAVAFYIIHEPTLHLGQ